MDGNVDNSAHCQLVESLAAIILVNTHSHISLAVSCSCVNPSACLCMTAKMFSLLPDYVLPYTVHLLAHDPDLKTHDHLEALTNIKE